MASSHRIMVGGLLLAIATALLVLSAFSPWWSVTSVACGLDEVSVPHACLNGDVEQFSFLPGGTLSANAPDSIGSGTGSDQGQGLNDTGGLYLGVEIALIVSVLVGLAGAAVAMTMAWRRPRSPAPVGVLGLLSLIVLVAAVLPVIAVAVGQPAALNADLQRTIAGQPAGNSPASSFWGACQNPSQSGNGCLADVPVRSGTETGSSWGPSSGWFLAIAGASLALVALLLFRRPQASPRPPGPFAPNPQPLTTWAPPATTEPTHYTGASPPSVGPSTASFPSPPPPAADLPLATQGPPSLPVFAGQAPVAVGCRHCGAPAASLEGGKCSQCGTPV